MKRWKNVAGSAFALLVMGGVLFIYGGDLKGFDFTSAALLPGLAGAVGLYVLVVLTGAVSWRILLAAFGSSPGRWVAERQLLTTQIAKYVPGNVAQYLGRAALTISTGVPAKTVGFAMVTETAVILLAGFLSMLLSIALFPSLIDDIQNILPNQSGVIWLGMAVVAFFALLLGSTLASTFSTRLENLPKVKLGNLFLALILSTASFLGLGWSLHLLVAAISSTNVPVSLSVTVFAAAWIAGLATPGAPGGLGVREGILTIGLAPFLGGAAALTVALLYRGVSVVGDVVVFALGMLMPKETP